MDTLVVKFFKQMNAVNIALDPMTRSQFKATFPEADPLQKIYVVIDGRNITDRVEKHFLPALLGIEMDFLAQRVKKVVFMDGDKNEIFFSKDLTNAEA